MADLTTPQLVITNAGLAAAQLATPTGPFIEIVSFEIGSAYGYTPTKDDLNINGELLYQGTPLTYKYVGDNTLDIVCRLPAEAGPFQFGEVALFLPGSVMFAKAAFADLQTKYSSLGTNVLSTYTFNCLLKLDQAVAVFKINTNCLPPDIWEVDRWSDVYPPALSANPDIPSILVHEPDVYGNASLITRSTDNQWSMAGNYKVAVQGTVVAATLTTLDFNQAEVVNIEPGTLMNEYVIETPDGYLRSCASETTVGSSIRLTLNDPLPAVQPVGAKIMIHSMQTNQTQLQITGDAGGTAVIKGKHVQLAITLDRSSINARSQTWTTAGTYSFVVPPGVEFLYPDAVGAGGGGAGSGGGDPTGNYPYDDPDHPGYHVYDMRGGGGGGGGGAGQPLEGTALPVIPGETITVVIGAGGIGGIGGAPGNSGTNGTDGTATTISGSFGTVTAAGGTGGIGGDGYGAPSGLTGGGGHGGTPGGASGIDGLVGCAGGAGGTSIHGSGGAGGRGATGNSTTHKGAPGQDGTGNGSGGGAGGGIYGNTSTDSGGDGGKGTDGYANLTW